MVVCIHVHCVPRCLVYILVFYMYMLASSFIRKRPLIWNLQYHSYYVRLLLSLAKFLHGACLSAVSSHVIV